jgi:fibronectin-binding autotransporter adhesin
MVNLSRSIPLTSIVAGALLLTSATSKAMMFYYSTELGVDLGSGTTYYDASRTSSNTDWNGANISVNLLGTFNLKGGTVKLYRDDAGNYINGNNTQNIYYKIYQGTTPAANTFDSFQLLAGGSGGTTTFLGGNDYEASNYTGSVNLKSPITSSGSWKMAVYFDGNASWGAQNYFDITQDDRGGLYYIADISAFYGATGAGTQGSAFSGSGKFVKSGINTTYTLNAANTYTGNTEIDQGTVDITGSGNLSNSSAIFIGHGQNADNAQLTLSGSTASFANNITINTSSGSGTRTLAQTGSTAQTLSGAFTMNRDVTINVTGSGLTISGVMSGGSTFTKTGTGSLTLSGSSANTFSAGTVTVSAGTLILNKSANTSAIAGRPVDIASGATLRTDAAGQIGSAPLVTVSGTFDLNGNSQTVALAGGGSVKLNGSAASGTLTISNSGSDTFSGTISDNARTDGAVTKVGTGTQILSGANAYDGTTTVSAGVLRIGNASSLGSTTGATTVSTGAVLELSNNIAVGAEALSLSGDGITYGGSLRSVNGNNSWAGNITNNSGARINSDTGSTLTIAGNIANAANQTLYFGGSGNIVHTGLIIGNRTAGNGALYKDGTGNLTLSSDNTQLTGLFRMRGGTVTITNGNSLGSGPVEFGDAGVLTTLQINSNTVIGNRLELSSGATNVVINVASGTTTTMSGTLSQTNGTANTTKFAKDGAGTLVLRGSGSTYNGQIQIGNGTVILGQSGSFGTNTTTANRGIDLGLAINDTNQANNVSLLASNGVTVSNSIYVAANTNSATRTIGISGGGTNSFTSEIYLDGTVTVDAGASASDQVNISGAVVNTGGLTKSGSGRLVLSAANTYSGGTTINQGTLAVTGGGSLSSTGTVNVAATAGASTFDISGVTTGITIGALSGGASGVISLGSKTLTINDAANSTFSGTISGSGGGITKTGGSALILSGSSANTYSGVTTINNGTVVLSKTAGVDAIAGNITIGDSVGGDVLGLAASHQIADTSVITLNGNVGGSRGIFRLWGYNETIGGLAGAGVVEWGDNNTASTHTVGVQSSILTINTASGTTSTSSGELRNTGVGGVTGTLSLVKSGSGTQILTGANNNYTGGTTVNGGVLGIATGASAGTGTITINSNAVLRATASLTNARNITITTGQTGFVEAAAGTTNTLTGTLSKNGSVLVLGGGGSHIVNGSITGANANSDLYVSNSTTTINSSNSYNGPTFVVAGGTLNNGIANALPTNTTLTLGQSGETSSTTNRYNLSGFNQTVDSVATAGSSVNIVTNSTGTANLTLNSSSAKSISNLTMGGSGLTLTKSGANTVTLASGNSIGPGTIAIQQGTLLLGAANQIENGTAIALSGGTLNTAGYADAVGKLTVSANSTIQGLNSTSGSAFTFSDIDLGNYSTSSGSTLTFLNSSGTAYSLGTVIQLSTVAASSWSGYSATSLNNFSSKISFSDANLMAQINFGGGTSGTTLTVAAIPEPKVYVAAGALALLIGYAEVRRRKKILSSKA